MSNNIKISFEYDETLWDNLERQTDNEWKIQTDQDELELFLMPKRVAGLQPSQDVITVLSTIVTPFAISLFANWIYDLMKSHKAKVVSINENRVELIDIEGIIAAIKKYVSPVKQSDVELKK